MPEETQTAAQVDYEAMPGFNNANETYWSFTPVLSTETSKSYFKKLLKVNPNLILIHKDDSFPWVHFIPALMETITLRNCCHPEDKVTQLNEHLFPHEYKKYAQDHQNQAAQKVAQAIQVPNTEPTGLDAFLAGGSTLAGNSTANQFQTAPGAVFQSYQALSQSQYVNINWVHVPDTMKKASVPSPEDESAPEPPKPAKPPTMDKDAPLKGRVSFYGQEHPNSRSTSWRYVQGKGWLHKNEEVSFSLEYRENFFTKNAILKKDALPYVSPDGERFFCSSADVHKHDLVQCTFTGYWADKESCIHAYNNNHKKVWGHKTWVERNGGTYACDYYHELFVGNRYSIKASKKYKVVSHAALASSGEFSQCPSCAKYFEKEMVKKRVPNFTCCDICWAAQKNKDSIKAWNHNDSLPIIKAERWRFGCVKDSNGIIHSIGKPVAVPVHQYFGVELEVEMNVKYLEANDFVRFDVARKLTDFLGEDFVYCKEDGSLTLNGKYSGDPHWAKNGNGLLHAGFEITSAPAALDYHRTKWMKLAEFEHFKAMLSWDTPTCGMHVHMSREPLTNLQVSKMLVFLNHKENRKFMRDISGRGGNKYCIYQAKKFTDSLHPERVISAGEAEARDRSRRVILNLAHPGTVEFRGFKGTVWPRHIIRNIEFCDALIKYTQPCSMGMGDCPDYRNFIRFVDRNRKTWPLLAEFFAKKEYIIPTKIGKKTEKDKLTLRLDLVSEDKVSEPKVDKAKLLVPSMEPMAVPDLPDEPDEPDDTDPDDGE